MATLQAYQVAAAALLGGFSPAEVPTAVAVARGESSYSTTSCTGQYCGLWQIGTKVNAAALGGGDWRDPVVNARAAKQLVSQRGWCGGRAGNGHCQNFEAYGMNNAGASWQAKLAEGARAYAEVQQRQGRGETLQSMVGTSGGAQNADLPFGLPNPGDALGSIADTASAIAGTGQALVDFGNKTARWISDPNNWLRVAEVIGGGILIAVGLRIAFNKQYMAMGKQVISWVVPSGKATQVAGKVTAAAKGAR